MNQHFAACLCAAAAGACHGADTIVVTGRASIEASAARSALPLSDTPVAAQSIGRATIDDAQADTLRDVLRNVSGVTPGFALGNGYERFSVRGFEQSLATYRNGIQMPFQRFQSANTERVEVLKGPSAAQYGMSDPGGVINIVTKVPQAKPAFYAGQRIASGDQYRTEAGATGAHGDVAWRIDGAYEDAHSFRDVVHDSDLFVAPVLHWQAAPGTVVKLGMEYDKAGRRYYDQGVLASGRGLLDVPRSTYYGQDGLYDEHRNALVDVSVEHALDADWSLSAGYLHHDNRKQYRSVYTYADLQPGDTQADRFAWFGPEHFKTQQLWAQAAGRLGPHHLLAGVQLSKMRGRASATNEYVDTIDVRGYRPSQSHIDAADYEDLAPAFVSRQDDRAAGVFVQDQWVLNDALNVLAALRYDRVSRRLASAYGSPLATDSRSDAAWSPRVGVLYKLSTSVAAFAGYAESFGPAFSYEPAALDDPEQARQHELGLKFQGFGLQGSAVLFDLTKRNIATPDPDRPGFSVSIGEARSRGLELDVQGALGRQLDLVASYAFIDTEITKDFSGNQGHDLPNAPRHQASLWLMQRLGAWRLGGGVYAASARFGDAANSYADSRYARLDLALSHEFTLAEQKATLRVNVDNVTSERYYLMRSRSSNMPSAPRSVTASLRVEF